MSDIFISYASADRERARMVADALMARGWSVWWDRTIPPGKEFDQVIEEALDAAKCVVVLWSRTSTASTWVKTEASDAMRRKILVPALIDDTKIPLEFRRLQAADLSDWQGETAHEQFDQLCESIEPKLSAPGHAVVPPPLPRERPPRRHEPAVHGAHQPSPAGKTSRTKVALAGVAAAVVVVALAGFLLNEYGKRIALEERLAGQQRVREQEQVARNTPAADAEVSDAAEQQRAALLKQARRAQREPDPPPRVDVRKDAAPSSGTTDVEWQDRSLRYGGVLMWTRESATLRFSAFDTPTGALLGQFTFTGDAPGRNGPYTIAGLVPVPLDSTTPYAHQHSVTLHFTVDDGVLRFVQNCQTPTDCFPAR
jgi:hypothetical protein